MALNKYDELLKSIQNTSVMLADNVRLDAPIINIDWDTRKITLPHEFQSFLGVQDDHQADTVYFCADRYFDSVDLSTMTCVVEYINASGEGRVCPILDIDTSTSPDKIYFGWKVSRGATKTAGTIRFALRIFSIDITNDVYVYNISTQPCSATILKGLGKPGSEMEGIDDLPVDQVSDLLARIDALEDKAVRWHDLSLG